MSLSPKIKIIVWLAIMLCFVEIRPISGYAYVPTENDHPFRNFELPERKRKIWSKLLETAKRFIIFSDDKRSIDGQEQESESDPFTALKTNLEFPTLSDSLILNAESK